MSVWALWGTATMGTRVEKKKKKKKKLLTDCTFGRKRIRVLRKCPALMVPWTWCSTWDYKNPISDWSSPGKRRKWKTRKGDRPLIITVIPRWYYVVEVSCRTVPVYVNNLLDDTRPERPNRECVAQLHIAPCIIIFVQRSNIENSPTCSPV